MDCSICLEDSILERDMHYMECLHSICFECFRKLLTDTCPLCRETINVLHASSIGFANEGDTQGENFSYVFEDDFIIPTVRKNRHEHKRQRLEIRKKRLMEMLGSYCDDTSSVFPNNKVRFGRKIRSL